MFSEKLVFFHTKLIRSVICTNKWFDPVERQPSNRIILGFEEYSKRVSHYIIQTTDTFKKVEILPIRKGLKAFDLYIVTDKKADRAVKEWIFPLIGQGRPLFKISPAVLHSEIFCRLNEEDAFKAAELLEQRFTRIEKEQPGKKVIFCGEREQMKVSLYTTPTFGEDSYRIETSFLLDNPKQQEILNRRSFFSLKEEQLSTLKATIEEGWLRQLPLVEGIKGDRLKKLDIEPPIRGDKQNLIISAIESRDGSCHTSELDQLGFRKDTKSKLLKKLIANGSLFKDEEGNLRLKR